MLIRWKNNRDNSPTLSNMLENFFGNDYSDLFNSQNAMPAVNVRESKNSFSIDVAAPGLNKEDFNISIEQNMLTISAQKETRFEDNQPNQNNQGKQAQIPHQAQEDQERRVQTQQQPAQEERFTRREFSYSSFQRSFTLPENVDAEKIEASYKDGILCIKLPKRDITINPPSKQIQIN